MSWSVGFDGDWERDIGYGVPAWCDHPECSKVINRGLAYVCGGEPYGGEFGCGLFFCERHLYMLVRSGYARQLCERCTRRIAPYKPKADHPSWIEHKATDPSWAAWRSEQRGEGATL